MGTNNNELSLRERFAKLDQDRREARIAFEKFGQGPYGIFGCDGIKRRDDIAHRPYSHPEINAAGRITWTCRECGKKCTSRYTPGIYSRITDICSECQYGESR